jgi:metallo-beta-lactamase class B
VRNAIRAVTVTTTALLPFFVIPSVRGQQATQPCEACAEWNRQQTPFQIFANTYYVGPRGLSAILITSNQGHVVIDAALPESAVAIASNVRALGFKVEDIQLILNSHVHFDHAGGIAELQRISGATVAATPWSASVLTSGIVPPSDPQFGVVLPMARVTKVSIVSDGETLRVGPLAVTAHATPGHTPGGTSWTWRSCVGADCADFVYADSLTAVSADGFQFTRSREYSNAVADFERSFRTLERLSCGILLTPHPEASRSLMKDPDACRKYVDGARERLRKRIAAETNAP